MSLQIPLPRLGGEVHNDQVIGTEVPASPEGRKRQEGAEGDRRTDLRRQAIGKSFRVLHGASREEAPEELIGSSATRLPNLLVRPGEQSETREWSTQEGPRKIGRVWAPEVEGLRTGNAQEPDQADRTTSEPSGHVVE
jgi:hypothetical protein